MQILVSFTLVMAHCLKRTCKTKYASKSGEIKISSQRKGMLLCIVSNGRSFQN